MKTWQSIFFQSPINRGHYDESELPQFNWEWPSGTWFQARRAYVRAYEPLRKRESIRSVTWKSERPLHS